MVREVPSPLQAQPSPVRIHPWSQPDRVEEVFSRAGGKLSCFPTSPRPPFVVSSFFVLVVVREVPSPLQAQPSPVRIHPWSQADRVEGVFCRAEGKLSRFPTWPRAARSSLPLPCCAQRSLPRHLCVRMRTVCDIRMFFSIAPSFYLPLSLAASATGISSGLLPWGE